MVNWWPSDLDRLFTKSACAFQPKLSMVTFDRLTASGNELSLFLFFLCKLVLHIAYEPFPKRPRGSNQRRRKTYKMMLPCESKRFKFILESKRFSTQNAACSITI